jgi:hypothetical protein
MTFAPRIVMPVLVAVAACIAGCAAPPLASDGASAGASFEVLSSRDPAPGAALAATDCEPLAARRERWARVAGPDDAPKSPVVGEVTYEHDGARVVRRDAAGTRVLVRAADGSVALAEQTDASDGSTVRFTPPLLLAPARLAAGDAPNADSQADTSKAGAPDRDPGRAQRSMRLGAAERVRTPLGEFDALRVDATFTMKVPFASMRRETSTWVVPGRGPVATRSDERILVMGIVPRNRTETRVLLPGDAP